MSRFRFLIIFTVFCSFAGTIAAQDAVLPALDYFKTVRLNGLTNLPDSFSGVLSGKTITRKLETIPADSRLQKDKLPYAAFAYSKINGINITVQNVDDLYKNLYRDLPKQFFAFDLILSAQNNDDFLKKYDISYQTNLTDLIIIKLAVKGAQNNLLLYVIPASKEIMRLDYMIGSKIQSSTIIAYTDISGKDKKYRVPYRFLNKIFNSGSETLPEVFDITSIQAK